MNAKDLLGELKSLGKEQTRKIYRRHGITGDVFGVSYADMGKLQKRIVIDQSLAEDLWATGNFEARVLATKIADPAAITIRTLEGWVRDQEDDALAGAIAHLASRTPKAEGLAGKWTRSKTEWTTITGWATLSRYLQEENDLSDAACLKYLQEIEDTIHDSRNWERYAMNNALIAIGVRNPSLRKPAVAAAKRIGKVDVDHGETGCKTPDAVAYIDKTWKHRKEKSSRQKSRQAKQR